jgi:hypothetical protein
MLCSFRYLFIELTVFKNEYLEPMVLVNYF